MYRRSATAAAVTAMVITIGAVAPAASAAGPGEPLFGDLDGDGVVDRARLAAAPPRSCAVLVELGRPEGGYLPVRRYTYQAPGGGASTACPDLGVAVDLDEPGVGGPAGTAELVLSWYGGHPRRASQNLLVMRNFTLWTGVQTLRRPNFVGLADFNGDRRPDVYVWTDQGQGFATYLNDGTGTLRPGPVRYCAGPLDHRLADFDRDGAMDVVIAYTNRCGDGSRGVVVVLDDGTVVELQGTLDDRSSWTILLLDADRRGGPDVITYEQPTGERRTFLSVGNGTFVTSPLAVQDAVTVAPVAATRIPVLANDWASRRARITIVTPPAQGTVEVTAGRTVTYRPGPIPVPFERFVYRITQDGRTSDATVIVRIPAR